MNDQCLTPKQQRLLTDQMKTTIVFKPITQNFSMLIKYGSTSTPEKGKKIETPKSVRRDIYHYKMLKL